MLNQGLQIRLRELQSLNSSRVCHDWQIRIQAFRKVEISMKKLTVGLSVLTLAVAVGCTESSSEGPQAVAPRESEQPNESVKVVANKPVAGEADNTFSLSMPFESVALTQGEEKAVRIGINRGENFREEVEIKLSSLPSGVTVEAAEPTITRGSTGVTLMLKAASDAALGDFTAEVTGHTVSSGADFSKEIKLTVSKSEVAS